MRKQFTVRHLSKQTLKESRELYSCQIIFNIQMMTFASVVQVSMIPCSSQNTKNGKQCLLVFLRASLSLSAIYFYAITRYTTFPSWNFAHADVVRFDGAVVCSSGRGSYKNAR